MSLPAVPRIESRRSPGAEPLRRKRVIPVSSSGFRRRAVQLLLVFVTLVLVVDALIGEKGLMQSMRARQEYLDMAATLETLKRNNAKLRDEMRRLNEDSATIESVAREQLGLIRPGEVVFILKDAKDGKN